MTKALVLYEHAACQLSVAPEFQVVSLDGVSKEQAR